MRAKITASHYVLPEGRLTNETLSERFPPKKVAGISKLSGIYERRVAPKGATSVDLGAECAKRMLEDLNIPADDFDMLIFASQTRDYILPASAFIIHEKLGLPQTCGAFDLPLGCAAFPYAMGVANGLIASGQCKKILLIAAETITRLIYPKDRGLAPLHGDGAASFVICASEDGSGFEFADFGADSSGWKYLIVPDGGMRSPLSPSSFEEKTDESGITTTNASIQMDGAAVFHFSISTIPGAIKKALAKNKADIASYDLVLLHQANKMMLDQIYGALGVPEERRFFFMEKIGNLSAASSPVLLAEALREGKLAGGGRLLLSAFGVGLTWGTFSMKFAPGSATPAKASTQF
ncbi:MAG: ketoacyl-ACP synthase III [Opitutales bacterium]|nr:ketoacyl-ACP synthase III [Opitutales bacterium]